MKYRTMLPQALHRHGEGVPIKPRIGSGAVNVNKICRFLAALALLIVQDTHALDPSGQSPSRKISSALRISCPAADFSVFMRAFSNDVDVQKAFTKSPLKNQRLDIDAEPEPRIVIQNLGRHQIQFPVLPLREERGNQLLEISVDGVTADSAKVTLFKPDTDYQIYYFFEKSACWKLVRIENWSL